MQRFTRQRCDGSKRGDAGAAGVTGVTGTPGTHSRKRTSQEVGAVWGGVRSGGGGRVDRLSGACLVHERGIG